MERERESAVERIRAEIKSLTLDHDAVVEGIVSAQEVALERALVDQKGESCLVRVDIKIIIVISLQLTLT
jgi:hypothetical protein